ncbi:winged helix-turn-helix transcriptional regulator [Actinomadura algeriensis]|uniref:DNA-binding HxlR family transcriptional regulator n=1 Tax=Actinomadura algeriensis TaxID=1679523 RepID=A0ABR9JPY7_9ACTN|nr:helix-turn-helix domain-containing protein [Actinomadura algeriensis]MBE1532170.1 DNA-binding HxlR family transcriptional regulator [Actinomadura algeriensis]
MDDVFRRDCPARVVLDHVTGRWGVLVLTALHGGDLRFFELRDRIEGISEKMLSQTLRTLVRDGLVLRTVEPTVPPRVTYALTDLGRGIGEPLRALTGWIRTHAAEIAAARDAHDRADAAAGADSGAGAAPGRRNGGTMAG